MEYNTQRERLIIPEYGRHIQEMVDYCKTIEDKNDRNLFAQAIISVMGSLNPHLRDVPDFQHKLWDQLFIMAEFDLDVDSPYPIPTKDDFTSKPNKIPYPKENNRYRYYGKNVQRMIDVAAQWEEGDKRDGLVKAIANQMKKSYLTWNKDTVDDRVILNQLKEMSNGKIDLTEEDVSLSAKNKLATGNHQTNNNHRKSNKRRKNRKRH